MASQVHSRSLVRLLKQFGTMQRGLGNQYIIVLLAEDLSPLKRINDKGDGLELRPALGDIVLVHSKGLYVELVRELFESAFIGDLCSKEE